MIETWLLDLDNTLYPACSGLFALMNEKIRAFMRERLHLAEGEIPDLIRRYREQYGITLGGLMRHHGVDPQEYSAFVHDLPLERFLSPDPELTRALRRLPGQRVVFTNGPRHHARSVLSVLGLHDEIEDVFDLAFMDFIPKPFPHGYQKVMETLAVEPQSCCLVDDSADNLDTARSLGMTTVLVAEKPHPAHYHVCTAAELPAVFDLDGVSSERGGRGKETNRIKKSLTNF